MPVKFDINSLIGCFVFTMPYDKIIFKLKSLKDLSVIWQLLVSNPVVSKSNAIIPLCIFNFTYYNILINSTLLSSIVKSILINSPVLILNKHFYNLSYGSTNIPYKNNYK